jgi:polysaccharide export outer membrane protein
MKVKHQFDVSDLTTPLRGDYMRLAIAIILVCILSVAVSADVDAPVYRLQVGDQVRFLVWGESGLGTSTEVLNDGSVSFPLVGRLVVEGMTLTEVEEQCRTALEIYLIDPIVNVVVTSPHMPRVKVLGKVRNPGKFNIQYGDTLLDAVAYAGGFDERCDIKRILILNKNYAKFVNLKSFLKGEELVTDIDVDLSINDGDLVFIPEVGRPNWGEAAPYISGIIQSLLVTSLK